MRLLLDTHAFLWWVFGDSKLSRQARHALAADETDEIFVSAASAWEITTKFRIGKLADAAVVAHDVAAAIAAEGFAELPISVAHAQGAGDLGGRHRDPFDRMLIAQTLAEGLTLVSNERAFDAYGVERLW
ncbi:MAG: type II toxin-antitoxin system VapC family toxin [Proteobacteria bacterium]|nr:type II toxin-antitoxin system VapC family toxin [Pseudomonadota bacterium]